MDNYQPRHARKAHEKLHNTIRHIIWGSIVIVSMILIDTLGRILIEVLP